MTEPQAKLNLEDPILAHFAYQHDLRARLWNTMENILDVVNSDEDPEDIVAAVRTMVSTAIDPAEIEAWVRAGRPLPYVQVKNQKLADAITEALVELYDLDEVETDEAD
jgi:hypothetical protein